MQVMTELAMLSTVVVQVTESLAVATVLPSFFIVSQTLMLPHTDVVEHVYVTFSLAAADVLSTVQVGVLATEQHCLFALNPTAALIHPAHGIIRYKSKYWTYRAHCKDTDVCRTNTVTLDTLMIGHFGGESSQSMDSVGVDKKNSEQGRKKIPN